MWWKWHWRGFQRPPRRSCDNLRFHQQRKQTERQTRQTTASALQLLASLPLPFQPPKLCEHLETPHLLTSQKQVQTKWASTPNSLIFHATHTHNRRGWSRRRGFRANLMANSINQYLRCQGIEASTTGAGASAHVERHTVTQALDDSDDVA